MAYLNANIPATYAQVRREYLYDLSGHVGESEDCIISVSYTHLRAHETREDRGCRVGG